MLEKEDIVLIGEMLDQKMDKRFAKQSADIKKDIRQRFEVHDRNMKGYIEERFVRQDLQMAERIEKSAAEVTRNIREELHSTVSASEVRTGKRIDALDVKITRVAADVAELRRGTADLIGEKILPQLEALQLMAHVHAV